ncbi:MAG TPA: HAD-IIB family hydrolase [Candidatus Saccharimonadales bacterium]|nr:HAD-IIB family hydrolase [Candidatus Saccharimonadales bacterium]
MKKKLIAFDLDGTLAPSKAPLPDRINELLNDLLAKYQVCIISGGKYELFEQQIIGYLHADEDRLANLHLMPTTGTRYYAFDLKTKNWKQVYAEDLTPEQKEAITRALKNGFEQSGWMPKKPWGDIIEDRLSQVTLSTLGQEAPLEAKETWDPTGEKKQKLRAIIAPMIPEFEVRAAGTTSIDVTKPGIDKAYGMQKLLDLLSITKEEVLFMGDKLVEGGNDYPVKAMGIDSMEVSHWQDTALIIQAILYVT